MHSGDAGGITGWLTRADFTELYGISVMTRANGATLGIGPSPIKLGKEVRYHPEDVWAFIESRRKVA